MADNITLSTGDVVRTDEIGGIDWPLQKLAIGADNSAAMVEPAADDQAAAGVLPAGLLIHDGSNFKRARQAADALAATGVLAAAELLWEPASGAFERKRSNSGIINALASAARTIVTTSAALVNRNAKAVGVRVVVTVAGTTSITPAVQVTPDFVTIGGGFSAITGVGTTWNWYYDAAATPFPRDFRIQVQKADSSSWTYSVDYVLLGGT